MKRASATAKINLALVVGPRRADGKHEVATVLQRIDLADRIDVERGDVLRIDGFPDDTLVAGALEALARAANVAPSWHARIEKHIPIGAGLGGGSSDAATALRLANDTLASPLDGVSVHEVAAHVGADVPYFLTDGPQLGTGDGTSLRPLSLPQDFWIVLLLPYGERKASTAEVYARFDLRAGADGFDNRVRALRSALEAVTRAVDLAMLPPNDLASSPHADRLLELGAFRADVSGAGPAVYGLFARERDAERAAAEVDKLGRVWVTAPAWYG